MEIQKIVVISMIVIFLIPFIYLTYRKIRVNKIMKK